MIKPLTDEQLRETAEQLVRWMSDLKYGDEAILHAIVCCDFVSRNNFVGAVANCLKGSPPAYSEFIGRQVLEGIEANTGYTSARHA